MPKSKNKKLYLFIFTTIAALLAFALVRYSVSSVAMNNMPPNVDIDNYKITKDSSYFESNEYILYMDSTKDLTNNEREIPGLKMYKQEKIKGTEYNIKLLAKNNWYIKEERENEIIEACVNKFTKMMEGKYDQDFAHIFNIKKIGVEFNPTTAIVTRDSLDCGTALKIVPDDGTEQISEFNKNDKGYLWRVNPNGITVIKDGYVLKSTYVNKINIQ